MGSDWKRAIVALSAAVITALVILGLYWARPILIPVVLAIFLTFILSPLVTRLQRLGLGRGVEVALAVGLVLLITTGVGGLLAYEVTQLADTLPDHREEIKAKLLAAKRWVTGDGTNRFGELVDELTEVVAPRPESEALPVRVESRPTPLTERLGGLVSPAAEVLAEVLLTFILTVFMLYRREDLRNRAIRLLGAGHITTTTKAVDDASRRISRFLTCQLLLNSTLGFLIFLGMTALGVKYAVLWGFLATLTRYIPYLGVWIGIIPPLAYSLATAPEWGGGLGQPLGILAMFAVLEGTSSNFVEPRVYGHSTGLSEVAQLVAAAFWAFLWGPIGLILSGPLTVCLLVLGRHVERFRFFDVLLGDQPPLTPKVAFYQRLAARDQDEASEIARAAVVEKGAEVALDEVVIPALCLARRDAATGALGEQDLHFAIDAAGEIAEEVAEESEEQSEADSSPTALPRVRLLLCPARDDAERIAAEMLARSLPAGQWEPLVAADETLASELLTMVEEFHPSAVVIGTMPPGGVSHTRYLITRLRRAYPDLTLLVGRWGCEGPQEDGRQPEIANVYSIDYSLAETRKRLAELYPVLAAKDQVTDENRARRALVGTAGA